MSTGPTYPAQKQWHYNVHHCILCWIQVGWRASQGKGIFIPLLQVATACSVGLLKLAPTTETDPGGRIWQGMLLQYHPSPRSVPPPVLLSFHPFLVQKCFPHSLTPPTPDLLLWHQWDSAGLPTGAAYCHCGTSIPYSMFAASWRCSAGPVAAYDGLPNWPL